MKTWIITASQTIEHSFEIIAASERDARKAFESRRGDPKVKRLPIAAGRLAIVRVKTKGKPPGSETTKGTSPWSA